MAFLKMNAENNQELDQHLNDPPSRSKYTSPDIQNEIIQICGGIIREKIVQDTNASSFFALIGDEATDVSTYAQVSICVRFFDIAIKQ